jgi:cobalt-zinc-cadmium efflux system membrane fusion protein
LRIADLSDVIVQADVQEHDAADLKIGKPVVVRTADGRTATGTLEKVSEVLDPARRTVAVRVRVANPGQVLRPNAFVDVVLPAADSPRVRVPSESIVTDGDKVFVFLEDRPRHLVRSPVVTGRERDGETEVVQGLTSGQRYVSRGAILLLNQVDLAD